MLRFSENFISDSIFAESDRFSPSSMEYINWVKRSLNRHFGSSMPMDGVPSERYRNKVRLFQREVGRPETGNVDSRVQDFIIKRNEGNRSYLNWVRKALATPGVDIITDGPLSTANSKGSLKSAGLRIGIRAFQKKNMKKHGLKVDGFVGAQTEIILMSLSGRKPPGYVAPRRRRFSPVLKPPPRTTNLNSELKKLLESTTNPTTKCLCTKLLDSRADHSYISVSGLTFYMMSPIQEVGIHGYLDNLGNLRDELQLDVDNIQKARLKGKNTASFSKRFIWRQKEFVRAIDLIAKRNMRLDIYDPRTRAVRSYLKRETERPASFYSCKNVKKFVLEE